MKERERGRAKSQMTAATAHTQTTKMSINKNCIKCNAPIKSHLNEL